MPSRVALLESVRLHGCFGVGYRFVTIQVAA
jgi:hypothetical protein